MKYKWIIKELRQITKDFLDASLNSELIANLLTNRGIDTQEKARAYLNPNFYIESKPEEIPDLIKAKERIIQAINKKEKITIFGDYDVDGVTATSCLLITLREFTDNIDFYIPNRLLEGYGLNTEAVRKIAKKNKETCHGTSLLITCDCGITNHKEIELANELGMDVIVTDHHSLPEVLPPACAVLNPKLLPEGHKLHFLPGVGVAYKLCEAILAEHVIARSTESATKQSSNVDKSGDCFVTSFLAMTRDDLLDLVTLGMIADLAPLVDENRYLVQIGLPKLARTKKVGLQELLRICGCLKNDTANRRDGETGKENHPTTEHVGFGIAPRLNAVGRLTDANLAVKLLTTSDLIEAIHISTELDIQNKQRQLLCEEILNEAITLISEQVDLKKDKCIVLAKENWHHGVIGIVASRIVEKYSLPTILIAVDNEQNIARGSGRSVSNLNIVEAVVSCSKHLEKYGGHKAACGLSLKTENLNNFIQEFKNTVNNTLKNTELGPVLQIDLELPTSNLNLELINKINKLAPFGFGNRMPLFTSKEVEILSVRSIGKNGNHLKLMLRNVIAIFEALIWNHDNNSQLNVGDKIKIAYTPKLNNYNGETSIQLDVKDWQILEDQKSEDQRIRREQLIEIFDFRDRTQECLKLLTSEPTCYFAEVEQKNYLPLKTYSRYKIPQIENIVLLEIPPDERTLIDIIKTSQAKKIYFAFPEIVSIQHSDILKRLIGMFKYVVKSKNSIVSKEELECALGLNKSTLAYAIETLVKIGFLSYNTNDREKGKEYKSLNINIQKTTRQNFNELLEYKLFVSELKQVLEFRDWILKAKIENIIKTFEKNAIKAKSVYLKRVTV